MDGADRYATRNLSETLNAQGRKARWLAAEVGVSESMISKLSNGLRYADKALAEKIAKTLGVPFSLLFELRSRSKDVSDSEQAA